MKLESARSLKLELLSEVVEPAVSRAISAGAFAVAARPMANMNMPRSLALGVARGTGKGDFRLAVRVQRGEAWELSEIRKQIEKRGKKEVDVRDVGRISKAAVTWEQRRHRPLRIGTSVGHYKITCGTLGCFVLDSQDRLGLLSNNHVLANENSARRGDRILQPGAYDGGSSGDVVGRLERFVRIRRDRPNQADAAFALLAESVEAKARTLQGIGTLAGVLQDPLLPGDTVFKLGRTTGLRKGRVTAIELDRVVIEYDFGNARFDDQIEIEGTSGQAFSAGGDSGSLVVDSAKGGVALLFAGSQKGGSNGKGLTYANPIGTVLKALKLKLA